MGDHQDTTVKVAVRIRPLNEYEALQDLSQCLDTVEGRTQIRAGENLFYTFDHVFASDTAQSTLYGGCVADLLNACFEGFNATILAYGQTGSGKTYTMGSSSDMQISEESRGIIPRVIQNLFDMISQKEEEDKRSTYKVHMQFLEVYGEDIKDLLDNSKTSKVSIRETRNGEVFVTGAREEFVSSFEQMMTALEHGTRNRTTAATQMNQTSSRSHAILTVILEHIIHTDIVGEDVSVVESEDNAPIAHDRPEVTHEVRKSKFHFVDLAGSERAKRTGAQGQTLREGIDINKGLLALGNVISALGDETKRGKVHVPYRDSKLTRMLQDSLGGNSKTLMICCVSPAAVNYNESLNALRYANRARNIKNKPVVNRDPTLLIIEELRSTLKVVASELYQIRVRKEFTETESRISNAMLLELAEHGHSSGTSAFRIESTSNQREGPQSSTMTRSKSTRNVNPFSNIQQGSSLLGSASARSNRNSTSSMPTVSAGNNGVIEELRKVTEANELAKQSIAELQCKLTDSDFEMRRLMDQLKLAKQRASEISEQLILARGERDYFKMRWSEACPQEAIEMELQCGPENDCEVSSMIPVSSFDQLANSCSADVKDVDAAAAMAPESQNPVVEEKKRFMRVISTHLQEIERLKEELAKERSNQLVQLGQFITPAVDEEFTTTVSELIAQTKSQLEEECRRLKVFENKEDDGLLNDADEELAALEKADKEKEVVEEAVEVERNFQRRQRMLNSEVQELGQSIHLKEQLMEHLVKSQQQYHVMKSYYEQKIASLSESMQEKEVERDRLLTELQELSSSQINPTSVQENVNLSAKELKLREELKTKELEIQNMKKKQDELKHLASVQAQYSQQVAKLQTEITTMKRQRVDLSKTLQTEKKNHMQALNEKAREIERLKKQLVKSSTEVKKLGRDKEMAELRAKDALREGAILKKKAQELARGTLTNAEAQPVTLASTREAIRAINRSTARWSNKRVLTEQELKTKRWLDQRIAEISAREAAADRLKRQYEQQLELLNRKEALEQERLMAMSKSESGGSDALSPSKNKDENNDESNPLEVKRGSSLSEQEQSKLLELIEERLSSVNGQLYVRSQKINTIQQELVDAGDVAGSDKIVETLKRSAAGTLSASYDVIRLLMDMLVSSNKTIKIKAEKMREQHEKEKQLQSRIDDLQDQLFAEKHKYDKELTKISSEYEVKLQNLFAHVSSMEISGQLEDMSRHSSFRSDFPTMLTAGNIPVSPIAMKEPVTDETGSQVVSSQSFATPSPRITSAGLMGSHSFSDYQAVLHPSSLERKAILEKIEVQLSILIEERALLKSQLEREHWKYAQMNAKYQEVDKIKVSLMRDLEEKNNQIKFLEEDRSLFKEMAEDLKHGLMNLGKGGKAVIDSVRERAIQNKTSGLFSEYINMGEDDDDETRSILGEFEHLGDEINRTGEVQSFSASFRDRSDNSSGSGNSIYDRLYNPSSYTGSMKTVFDLDIETRRKRTQQIRNQEKSNVQNNRKDFLYLNVTAAANSNANANNLLSSRSDFGGPRRNSEGNKESGNVNGLSGANIALGNQSGAAGNDEVEEAGMRKSFPPPHGHEADDDERSASNNAGQSNSSPRGRASNGPTTSTSNWRAAAVSKRFARPPAIEISTSFDMANVSSSNNENADLNPHDLPLLTSSARPATTTFASSNTKSSLISRTTGTITRIRTNDELQSYSNPPSGPTTPMNLTPHGHLPSTSPPPRSSKTSSSTTSTNLTAVQSQEANRTAQRVGTDTRFPNASRPTSQSIANQQLPNQKEERVLMDFMSTVANEADTASTSTKERQEIVKE